MSINAFYPGASAKTVEDSVIQVIEQKLKGLDGLIYMNASSDSRGGVALTLTFAPGVDPDIAQVQVQNKLQLAVPLLPQEVQRQGIQVNKSSSGFLMREEGLSPLEAVRLRLRPVLMTSLAFGLGVLPLAISTGAGSGSRNAVGTSVLGGMITATVLGVFFVPLFFVVIRKIFGSRKPVDAGHAGHAGQAGHSDHPVSAEVKA